jgi:hypothetical protein
MPSRLATARTRCGWGDADGGLDGFTAANRCAQALLVKIPKPPRWFNGQSAPFVLLTGCKGSSLIVIINVEVFESANLGANFDP